MRSAPHEKSSRHFTVSFLEGGNTTHTWTDMPASGFLLDNTTSITKVDLTDATQVRLIVNKQGVAGATNSMLRIVFKAGAYSSTLLDYVTIGAGGMSVAVDIDTTDTVLDSGWFKIRSSARADVFLAITGANGDGAADPEFGTIEAHFR